MTIADDIRSSMTITAIALSPLSICVLNAGRRMGQQLPVSGRQARIRGRRERRLHATAEHEPEKP
jgi:hypothetical protein